MGMPYPRLIHPTPVKIAQLDRSATVYDDKTREPIGRAARDVVVELEAQVWWKFIGKPEAQAGGVREDVKGYLLFRWGDLQDANITLKRGDRVVQVGDRVVNLFITYFEDMAHYTVFNGSTFLKAWVGDRRPSEQDGDL